VSPLSNYFCSLSPKLYRFLFVSRLRLSPVTRRAVAIVIVVGCRRRCYRRRIPLPSSSSPSALRHRCCCPLPSSSSLMPVSLRLSRASGWLLHCHLSCRASASLVVLAPLSLHHHLSHCAAASLVAPHLRRLVVASPTILTCRHLSCRASWLLPCYLSLCAVVSLFATSLIAQPCVTKVLSLLTR